MYNHLVKEITYYDELPSTNEKAKEIIKSGLGPRSGFSLAARRQSAGKGSRGRSFESPEGGLYFTSVSAPMEDVPRLSELTPATAIMVRDAVKKLCGLECCVKWPNDLVYGGKKLCGILCESICRAGTLRLIIGIGINLSTDVEALMPELADKACSLAQLGAEVPDFEEAAEELALRSHMLFEHFSAGGGMDEEEYRRGCVNCPDDIVQIYSSF